MPSWQYSPQELNVTDDDTVVTYFNNDYTPITFNGTAEAIEFGSGLLAWHEFQGPFIHIFHSEPTYTTDWSNPTIQGCFELSGHQ